MPSLKRNVIPIVVSIIGCTLMVVFQRFTPNLFSGIPTSLAFTLMIAVSGVLGGWRSGAISTTSGILTALFLFSPSYIQRISDDRSGLVRLMSFAILGAILCGIGELLQRAWRRIDDRQQELEAEIRLRRLTQLAEQARADELMTTLASIADGVITTDSEGRVRFINSVAEALVGWKRSEAVGQRLASVFRVVNEQTHEPVENPADLARRQGVTIGFDKPTLLIARDGTERLIDESAAPIQTEHGHISGTVLVFRDITEKRKTQLALQEQQQRALVLLESISEAFFSIDREWKFTYVNGPAGRLLNATADRLVRRCLWDVFPGFTGSEFEAVFRMAMDRHQEGSVTAFSSDLNCDAEVRAYPTPEGISVFVNDVSKRRRMEAERDALLRQIDFERARLADIFEHAPSFMCVLSGPDHLIERANDRYRELIGDRDVVGMTIREAFPEIAGQGYFEIVDGVYRSGETRFDTDQKVVFNRNGQLEERVIDFVYQPLKDARGATTGVLLQGIDLTSRQKAENDLARVTAESERQRRMFETALSNTPDFIYLFDCEGRFTYVNKSLLTLWQKEASEVLGRNFEDLNYPADVATLLQRQIEDVVRTQQPVRDEVLFTSSLGTRSYEHIFTPVFGSDGEVEAVAGSSRDITDRKESERALRQADRNKDDFLALLAHELRNPLAPIRNGLQVLRLSQNAEERDHAQTMMDRQLTHMVRLIDDLLDMSRINRHKMELRRTRLTLEEAINSAVETAMPAIQAAGHTLEIHLPPQPVFLDADLTRLAQVFSNLLTNSARYTHDAGLISVDATLSGDEVCVTVKDNGIGIPADALPHLFDMFSQVDRSMERATGGLGIGLALVKGLVEMHGGTVRAASEGLDKGSEFTVRLPVISDDPPQPPARKAPEGLQTTPSKRRILVVDDNQDSASSMAMMLRLLGNETDLAADGIEAVERAESFQPHVILMDIGMPRLNGLDAARRIRQQEWGADMRIVALTGWGQESDREQSWEAGCNGHLVKPVSLDDLQKMLNEPSFPGGTRGV
ncbi:PAS domain-containing protein [Schlesneria sp. DSM 10557]|uniref:PAS domain-containing hybrid sensor histidine kinase/response regulator n=1 Tax=Schlesneria sp. DSM 10557 TaxID=3044399 RepID=UPI00359F69B5